MYAGSELIRDFVPCDHSRQVSSSYFLEKIIENNRILNVLDLGCGEGKSKVYFKTKCPNIKWFGIDISSSPEVDSRKKREHDFYTFDGLHMPFKNASFDLIYCNQVLEHVEKPRELIQEVERILKPSAHLVGSVSSLELFHSLSIFNFTPYGFIRLLNETSLKVIELRPGIDFFALFLNRLTARQPLLNKCILCWFEKETPFNYFLTIAGKITKKTHQKINILKLLFCGHFRFLVQKTRKDDGL